MALRPFQTGISSQKTESVEARISWACRGEREAIKRMQCASALYILMVLCSLNVHAENKFEERVRTSTELYSRLLSVKKSTVPEAILNDSRCIAVLRVLKTGLGFIGSGGTGIVSCRGSDGKWSAPSFVKVQAGGFGFGPKTLKLVLFAVTDRGQIAFIKGKFKLGKEVRIVEGPIVGAETTPGDTDIYGYELKDEKLHGYESEGATITPDKTAIREFYGYTIDAGILLSRLEVPELPRQAADFMGLLPSGSPSRSIWPIPKKVQDQIVVGMTDIEVEEILGKPPRKVTHGKKVIYKYNGLAIEFEENRVVYIASLDK